MATWNTTFETSPADGDNISEGAGKIRELKVEVGDRGNREHTWAGTTAADGIHRAGSAKVYFTTATPTLQPDGVTALTTTDKGRMWHSTSTLYVHNGTAFVSTGVTLSTAQTINGVKTFKSAVVLSGGVRFSDAPSLKCKVMSIGDWNMDTTASKTLTPGIAPGNIRDVVCIIIDDNSAAHLRLDYNAQTSGWIQWSTAGVNLIRAATSGSFDNTLYNATSFNRGWVTIWYVA